MLAIPLVLLLNFGAGVNAWGTTYLVDSNNPDPNFQIDSVNHIRFSLTTDGEFGLEDGFAIEQFVRGQPDPQNTYSLFPRKITFTSDLGSIPITVENLSPGGEPEFTRIYMDGLDISDYIVEIQINLDADANEAYGWYTYATINPLGGWTLNEVRLVL